MKHTKGKWLVGARGNATSGEFEVHLGNSKDRDGYNVSRKVCIGKTNSFEEASANANLIASAPEMLDALKRFLTAPVYKEGRDHIGWCYLEGMERIVAKAEGK